MACSSIQNSSAVTLEDCTCPICMSILIQPVTMPCTHELCMPCFRKTVEEANLCCPMCRLRISTWARLSTKQKTLVNEIRWKQIQNLFPDKVRRRQEGKDDEDDDINDDEPIHHPIVNIAEPGEIRKEYEEQLEKLERQRLEERSKEEAESADLIKKLQNEEEERVKELERQAEEQRLKDEEIARKLAESAELSLIESGEDCILEISPKLTRTHSTGSSSKQNTVQTLDSFFFNKSSTDTSILEDSPDIAQSANSKTPQRSTSSEPDQFFSSNTFNKLEDMPYSHREFVKNQFHVMSNYSSIDKPANKSAPATVTSEIMVPSVTLVDNNDTSNEDSRMIFPPVPSPNRTSPTPCEFSISNVSPSKKVVGLFPPQVINSATENPNHLCSKHGKVKHKNVSKTAKLVSIEMENENGNRPNPVNDKTVSFVDSDYESDENPSKSATDSVFKKNGPTRKSKNKHSNLNSEHESDSASEDSQSPKIKKVLKKRKSKTESVLSPQRSIKEWFSPSSSKKPEKSDTQLALKLETSPKKQSKKSSGTTMKNGKKNSPATKSLSKSKPSNREKIERPSRGVSKSLQYEDEDSNSTPLTSKDNILNTENVITEVRKSRKSRHLSDTESLPSPSKRRRKRSHKSSDEDSENSESVSRSRSHSRKAQSTLTVISEGETTPNKKSAVSLESDDDFIVTSNVIKTKKKTSPRKTATNSPRKVSINSPKKKIKKTRSPEKVNNIEKQVLEKRKSALKKKQTKLDFDGVFTNDKTELDDFELALKLQKEFDKEAKLASQVDRSKGSDSEYSLRHKSIHSPTKTK